MTVLDRQLDHALRIALKASAPLAANLFRDPREDAVSRKPDAHALAAPLVSLPHASELAND